MGAPLGGRLHPSHQHHRVERRRSLEDLHPAHRGRGAFRIQKSELAIRPIWHHKADRIKAHILVCFLGYALWKTLQQWQSRAGLGHSPRTILEEFSRIHAADIVLPLADASKRELRIRCVVRPDREQAILLEPLGLKLPERLRPPQMPEM